MRRLPFSKLIGIPVQLGIMFFLWSYIISKVDSDFDIVYVMGYYSLILVLSLQFPFIRLSNEIEQKVYNGEYFRNLISGVSLTREYFLDFLARTTWFNSIALPVSLIIYHSISESPFHIIDAAVLTLHIILGSAMLFFLWLIVGFSAFVFVMNRGLASLVYNIQRLCIGSIVPLTMLPETMYSIVKLTPFPYAFYFATVEYMGANGTDYMIFVYQVFWCIALGLTAYMLEKRTITNIEMGAV
jgi:ABC-2 type transport system permease protein